MGQVLEQVEPTAGTTKKDGTGLLSRKQAASDAGISERQQKTALRVASISEDHFWALSNGELQSGNVESLGCACAKRL